MTVQVTTICNNCQRQIPVNGAGLQMVLRFRGWAHDENADFCNWKCAVCWVNGFASKREQKLRETCDWA